MIMTDIKRSIMDRKTARPVEVVESVCWSISEVNGKKNNDCQDGCGELVVSIASADMCIERPKNCTNKYKRCVCGDANTCAYTHSLAQLGPSIVIRYEEDSMSEFRSVYSSGAKQPNSIESIHNHS